MKIDFGRKIRINIKLSLVNKKPPRRPNALFSNPTPIGGDMGSHYFTAEYLRNQLLPQWKISGWCWKLCRVSDAPVLLSAPVSADECTVACDAP